MMYHTLDIYCEECVWCVCVCRTKVRKIILQKYMGILRVWSLYIYIYISNILKYKKLINS